MSTLIQRDWGTAMGLLLLVREGREPGTGELKAALAAIETDAEPCEAAS